MHGSHFPYEGRYSREERRFAPTLADIGVTRPPGPEHKAATVNSYDNTLVALDHFMQRVHASLAGQDRPVLLLYTSDHGENLFDDERQRFMHAHNEVSRYELRVPLLIWGNEAYRRWRPEAWAALQAHRTSKLSHLDVFPTVLDLARISWDGQLPGDSFASGSFQPKPRPLMDLSDHRVGDADLVR
jgi:glucan phosphoethanolaminetransferase (alkaline phosphatase superfamily)